MEKIIAKSAILVQKMPEFSSGWELCPQTPDGDLCKEQTLNLIFEQCLPVPLQKKTFSRQKLLYAATSSVLQNSVYHIFRAYTLDLFDTTLLCFYSRRLSSSSIYGPYSSSSIPLAHDSSYATGPSAIHFFKNVVFHLPDCAKNIPAKFCLNGGNPGNWNLKFFAYYSVPTIPNCATTLQIDFAGI